MTTDGKFKDEKSTVRYLQKTYKTSAISSSKIDKYKYLKCEEILPPDPI